MDRRDARGPDNPERVAGCEPIRLLLPLAALDVLDPREAEAVERHLSTCRRCRHEQADYARTVDLLALSVPVRPLPPRLRRRVLDALRTDPWPFAAPARRWLAAAVLLILVLTGSNVVLWQRLATARDSAVPPRAERAAPGPLTWYDLVASTPGATAQGTLCAVPDGRLAWLIVQGLPPLAPGQVYQLWFVHGDQWISGGTFTVDQRGRGFLTIWPDQPLGDYETLGITVEPAGGSPYPTSLPILAGLLA